MFGLLKVVEKIAQNSKFDVHETCTRLQIAREILWFSRFIIMQYSCEFRTYATDLELDLCLGVWPRPRLFPIHTATDSN